MKQFKLFAVIGLLLLSSCTDEGEAAIENNLVVEQIRANEVNNQCVDCLQNNYKYRVKLESTYGTIWYYTNYKYEVGDTLISVFEFTDNREVVVKKTEMVLDSVQEANTKLHKKNEELTLYNELLMGIIQDGAKKNQ